MIKRTLFLSATALVLAWPTTQAFAQKAAPTASTQGAAPADELAVNAPPPPSGPAPRGLDGKPDFSGYWKGIRDKTKPGGNLGKDEPKFELPLTPLGKRAKLYAQNHTPDPEALCFQGGIPRHNASGLPFEVLQTPTRFATAYLYNTHRLVSIGDGLKPDKGAESLYFGHAAAHWDQDTLVIETRGLKDSAHDRIWADENGDPTSSETTVVERWSRPDAGRLHLVMTVTDPKYYTRPVVFTRDWALAPAGQGAAEYSCNENNVDGDQIGPGAGPIGPDGNRGYGYDAPLPKDPPGPDAYFNN